MTERFYYAVLSVFATLGEAGVLLVSLSINFAIFILVFILSLCVNGYKNTKKLWAVALSIGVFFAHFGLSLICNKNIGYPLITIFFSILQFTVVFYIRVKEKTTKKQRALANYFDNCAKVSDKEDDFEEVHYVAENQMENLSVTPANENTKKLSKKTEIDFQHVKNVVERLELCTLSPSDKKAIIDLKTAVYTAENMGVSEGLKEKINDGLSALLKIMAKYGI